MQDSLHVHDYLTRETSNPLAERGNSHPSRDRYSKEEMTAVPEFGAPFDGFFCKNMSLKVRNGGSPLPERFESAPLHGGN